MNISAWHIYKILSEIVFFMPDTWMYEKEDRLSFQKLSVYECRFNNLVLNRTSIPTCNLGGLVNHPKKLVPLWFTLRLQVGRFLLTMPFIILRSFWGMQKWIKIEKNLFLNCTKHSFVLMPYLLSIFFSILNRQFSVISDRIILCFVSFFAVDFI